MEKLYLHCFGQPQIVIGGQNKTAVLAKKAQAILFYLALTKKTHERTHIAYMFWPNMSDSKALKNLRDILPSLRKEVGAHLQISRHTLQFEETRPYFLDVEAFENKVLAEPKQADLLFEAADLYRAEFLDGFQVNQAEPFENWVMMTRERLHETAVQNLDALIDHCVAERDWAVGLDITQRLLTLEPWRESAHRQRMLLFAYTNQRGAALAQFESCRRILEAEFDVEPMSETRELYERIRAGRNLDTFLAAPEASLPQHNLPRMLTPFYGREDELAHVVEKLNDPNYPLITLMGEGGIGKTRLALASAQQTSQTFADGVWFVPLANIASSNNSKVVAESIAEAISEAIHIKFHGTSNLTTQIIERLRNKELLLLLDNFEHLMAGTDFILSLLQACPHLNILLTSRESLHVQAEFVLRMSGLPVPEMEAAQKEALTSFESFSSLQLFAERAGRLSLYELDAAHLADVIRICQLVQGLPLGIELAAALAQHQSYRSIVTQLETNYETLTSNMRDLPERHRNIRAVFNYSWELLPDNEAFTLAQCSIFQGGFTDTAVQAIANVPSSHLYSLVSKSLLVQVSTNRFQMHELLRQFAAEKLGQHPEERTLLLNSHCDYYLTLLAEQFDHIENQPQVVQALQLEIGNIRNGWKWAVEQARVAPLLTGVLALSLYLRLVGYFREAWDTFALAIEKVRKVVAETDSDDALCLLAFLLIEQSFYAENLINLAEAEALAREGVALSERVANAYLQGSGCMRIASISLLQGNTEESTLMTRKGIAMAREGNFPRLEVIGLTGLGLNMQFQKRYEAALSYQTEAVAVAQKRGYRRLEGIITVNLGGMHMMFNHISEAMQCYENGLRINREVGDWDSEGISLIHLGSLWHYVGQYDTAHEILEDAAVIFEDIGNRKYYSRVLHYLAMTLIHLGRLDEAFERCQQSQLVAQEGNMLLTEVTAVVGAGHVLLAKGNEALALQQYQAALTLLASEESSLCPVIYASIAHIYLQQGKVAEAMEFIARVLPELDRIRPEPPTIVPASVYLLCYQVLEAAKEARAQALLKEAAQHLQAVAAAIDEDAIRRSFLENVPAHREILRLHGRLS